LVPHFFSNQIETSTVINKLPRNRDARIKSVTPMLILFNAKRQNPTRKNIPELILDHRESCFAGSLPMTASYVCFKPLKLPGDIHKILRTVLTGNPVVSPYIPMHQKALLYA
jgi:hypothetical protein